MVGRKAAKKAVEKADSMVARLVGTSVEMSVGLLGFAMAVHLAGLKVGA